MRVEILQSEHPRWPECLSRLRHDFYHGPLYTRLEARRIQAVPEAFMASEGEKLFFLPYLVRSCEPIFPAGMVTSLTVDVVSPYGYPGMLISDAGREPGFARSALDALRETLAAKGVCSGFFRMHPLLNANVPALFPPNLFTDDGDTVAIDLRLDEDAIWKGLRENHQWTINKCSKAGFTARTVPLLDYLDEFMVTYSETMNRVKAKKFYYFERDYFLQLAQMPGVFCCIAERQGKVCAACIFFECDGITQAHLGGTKNEFRSKSPFHLLLYHAAMWAKGRGSSFLHLGGGVGGANDWLLSFKAGFSPLRFRFLTLRLITNEHRYGQLVDLRAGAADLSRQQLMGSTFFPAYRAML